MNNAEVINRIYRNTKVLARARGLKTTDIEKKLGVAAGHISRTIKRGDISFVLVASLAEMFGITIDDLVYTNYEVKEIDAEIDELKEKIKELEERKMKCEHID